MFHGRRGGGIAIEFALVLPVLVSFIACIFQEQMVLQAVRKAARTGSITPLDDGPAAAAEAKLAAALAVNGIFSTGATLGASLSGSSPYAVVTVMRAPS